jgi:uncharacterized protein YoaH (UPF0181 family)
MTGTNADLKSAAHQQQQVAIQDNSSHMARGSGNSSFTAMVAVLSQHLQQSS